MIKLEAVEHNRKFKSVKEEGHIFGRYYSKSEYIYSVGATLYIEYMRAWGTNERMVKVWSFGENKNFVTDAVPLAMAREAKKVILAKLRGE